MLEVQRSLASVAARLRCDLGVVRWELATPAPRQGQAWMRKKRGRCGVFYRWGEPFDSLRSLRAGCPREPVLGSSSASNGNLIPA